MTTTHQRVPEWLSTLPADISDSIQKGVLLASLKRNHANQSTLATAIVFSAAPGHDEDLTKLLIAGADIIATTEPLTLLWYALRLSKTDFMIFDTFASEDGRSAHFAGTVAALLKEKAGLWVPNGWEQGVVANVQHVYLKGSKSCV